MFKRTTAIILLSMLVIAGGALAACTGPGQEAATTVLAPVTSSYESADLVAAEAVIVPVRQAELSFKTAGQVLQVLVSQGDTVVAGQELMKMDTRDLDQAVRRAEAELKSAEATAAKAKSGSRAEEIAAAAAAVAVQEAAVKAAGEAVRIAEGRLAAAKAQVATTQTGVEVARGNLSAAQAAVQGAQATLNKLVAGPTRVQIAIAEQQVERAKNNLWGVQRQREFSPTTTEGDVAAAEAAVKIAQLQLDNLKKGTAAEDLAVARAQVAEASAAAQIAQGQLKEAQSRVAQITARVAIAEGQLTQAKSQVESAKAQAQQAQAQLDAVTAGARTEDVAVAEAAVARATAALTAARSRLADAVLTAPFDGTVGNILVNEGEYAAPQSPVLSLGDLTRWQVQTEDLGEVDVSRVAVGQDATVTVDALAGKKFAGKVTEVASIASDRRGDKVYTVTADLDSDPQSGLRWGMSSFLEIATR